MFLLPCGLCCILCSTAIGEGNICQNIIRWSLIFYCYKSFTHLVISTNFVFLLCYNSRKNDQNGENAMLNIRLAFLRIGKGWSQAELARRIGVSASAVGMYEQGRREPSLSLVVQLAREFGVSTDYLLTGETQQRDPSATSEAPQITVRVENLIRYLLSTAE